MYDDDYLDDIAMICCNCRYEYGDYQCNCEERINDIKNGTEKDCSQYCVYFKEQDWITKRREERNK